MNTETKTVTTVNPFNGEFLSEYPLWTNEKLKGAIRSAEKAFHSWSKESYLRRSEVLGKAADLLAERQPVLAQTMALEMGKPISSGESEVEKCAWVCRFYAENAERFLADEAIETDPGQDARVIHSPLGIVFAIMPWNYPLWQVFRFAAPGLMAGNVGLLKHAANVPQCGRAIEAIFRDAGLPEGGFTFCPIDHEQSSQIIAHPAVRAVTLTGSTGAGRKVAEMAGKHLKKCVLELGGSDPYVVLADADLSLAATCCATSRMLNAGQSCIAAKRFIAVESVLETFSQLLGDEMRKAKLGNPLDPVTTMGPMARFDLRDELQDQVNRALKGGAKVFLGNQVPDSPDLGKGAFFAPTILADVEPGNPAFEEEMFGPVASVVSAANEEEALELANRSNFGLGSAIFSRDEERALLLARTQMDAGNCAINGYVKSDPRLPFGGVKQSGFGRELSYFGIREFVNTKSVVLSKTA